MKTISLKFNTNECLFKVEDEKNLAGQRCDINNTPFATFLLFWVLMTDAKVTISHSFLSFDKYYITTSTLKDYKKLKGWLEDFAEAEK